jgi:hypothetical protein
MLRLRFWRAIFVMGTLCAIPWAILSYWALTHIQKLMPEVAQKRKGKVPLDPSPWMGQPSSRYH